MVYRGDVGQGKGSQMFARYVRFCGSWAFLAQLVLIMAADMLAMVYSVTLFKAAIQIASETRISDECDLPLVWVFAVSLALWIPLGAVTCFVALATIEWSKSK